MEQIEGKDDTPPQPVEEVMEEKKAEQQEFAFRLPGNLDQSMGLLNSMLKDGNPQNILNQFMGGAAKHPSESQPQQPHPAQSPTSQRPGQMDFKMLEQSLGMVGSLFNMGGHSQQGQQQQRQQDQQSNQSNAPNPADFFGKLFGQASAMGGGAQPNPADMLGKLFGQGAPGGKGAPINPADLLGSFFGQSKKQEQNVYPHLDNDNEQPKDAKNSKPQSPFDFEGMLSQGLDKISLSLKDDVVGKYLGKPTQPQEPSAPSLYPKLDDLDDSKPKQPDANNNPQKSDSMNLENVLNQGIDAIGSAFKGNAGNIFGQFINVQPQPKDSTPSKPSNNEDDVKPLPFAVVPDPLEKPEPSKPKEADKPKEAEKTKSTSADSKKDDVIDFIPDEAFEEAFDGLAGLK